MAVGLRSLLRDGCLAGDLWGPSSARDECLHVLLGRIIRGFERRVRILEPCDCLGKKEGAPKDFFMIALIRCAQPPFGAVGAMRRLSLLELKAHKVPVTQSQDPRCDVPMQLLCYRTRASQ